MKTIKEIIAESDIVIITAGAGFGADSGLATFRGDKGFWKAFPALGSKGIDFSSIANPQAFRQFPELAWGFYGLRYNSYNTTTPHIGFNALLELVKNKKDYFVVTSNVDGHFQKAGFPEDKVYEIHGRINTVQCMDNCGVKPWKINTSASFNVDPKTLKFVGPLPRCKCGALARPNIMMFNDNGFDDVVTNTQEKAFNTFMHKYDKDGSKIVVIEFGAGTAIPTIRNIGEFIHKKVDNAVLIRISPTKSEGPEGIISIAKGAVDAISEDIVSDDIKNLFFIK